MALAWIEMEFGRNTHPPELPVNEGGSRRGVGIEAAMMETPSLVIEGSCAAEGIVHGDNGFICRCDEASIAESIVNALPLCGQAGARARATIPVPWDDVAAMVEKRYQLLIEKKKQK